MALASALMMMITLRNRLELNRVRGRRKIGLYRESLSYKWGKETLYGKRGGVGICQIARNKIVLLSTAKRDFLGIKKVEEGAAPYISRERREREDKSFPPPPPEKRRKKNLKCKSPSSLSFLSVRERKPFSSFLLMFS